MVIASAGRRIDAPDAEYPRFPASAEVQVARQILAVLKQLNATVLVCSAACGADILALEAAGFLGIRRRVVLPSSRESFRNASVVDRPGNWGTRYDAILDDAEAHSDLIVLGSGDYRAANERILDEAQRLSADVGALVIWDGHVREDDDFTEHFRHAAMGRRIPVTEIPTLKITS